MRAVANPRAAVVLLVAVTAAVLFYVVRLGDFGRLEYDDYYGLLPQVIDAGHVTTDPLRWLRVKSNEHTVAIPMLVYVANAEITAGDNRALSVVALALLVAIVLLLWPALPTGGAGPPISPLAGALLLSGLVLSPAGSASVVVGFSGVMWFCSLAFAVLAIAMLRRCVSECPWWRVGALVAAGWASSLSFSSGLFLWPALLAGALLYRFPWRRIAVLCAGAAAPFALMVATYVRPPQHPKPALTGLKALVEFLGVYLGAFLASNPWVAGGLGLAGIAAFAFVGLRLLRGWGGESARELVPWLVLAIFGLGNAAGTAVARAGLGGARSSRYAPVAAMFWIGLAVLLAGLVTRAARRRGLSERALRIAPLVVVIPVVAATWWRGVPEYAGWLERAAWQPVAELAFVHGIPDHDVLEAVSIAPDQALSQREFLAALKHVPFDRPADLRSGDAVPVEAGGAPRVAATQASVTAVVPQTPAVVRVEGVLAGETLLDRRLVILDGENRCRGLAWVVDGPSLLERLGLAREQAARWAGYVAPWRPDDALRVFARSGRGGAAWRPVSAPWTVSTGANRSAAPTRWRRQLGFSGP